MKWTEKENNILVKYYSTSPFKEILLRFPERTEAAVRLQARKLNLKSKHKWTEEEIKILKDTYSTLTPKKIQKLLPNRKSTAIRCKAEKLNLVSYKTWTDKDIKYLKEHYAYGTWEDLTAKLNRTKSTIVTYARNFKLVKETRPNKRWPEQDIKFLEDNYLNMPMRDLMKKLGRSKDHIIFAANNRGLARAPVNESSLESLFAEKLDEMNIEYEIQVKAWKYKIDFVIDKDIAIELQGTYWHCDSRVYSDGPKYETQKKAILRDKRKNAYLKSKGFKTVIIWENDFYDNWKEVNKHLTVVLQGDLQDYDSANTVKLS